MGPIPYKGLPENVLPGLTSLVSELVNDPPVSAFCIGLSAHLSAVREKHGCQQVFAIYESENAHETVLVEDELEKALNGHRKYYGDVEYNAEDARAHACCVYLAVWTTGSEKRVPAV
jgi:hypothetical protein